MLGNEPDVVDEVGEQGRDDAAVTRGARGGRVVRRAAPSSGLVTISGLRRALEPTLAGRSGGRSTSRAGGGTAATRWVQPRPALVAESRARPDDRAAGSTAHRRLLPWLRNDFPGGCPAVAALAPADARMRFESSAPRSAESRLPLGRR
jgi:hypothetical protein